MKILVLSDSHSGLSFMRMAIRAVKPDAVVHLGDYFDDGETMSEEFRHIRFHQVPGNCDRYRSYKIRQETLCYAIGGVMTYMTHGHNHHVKNGLYSLVAEARAANAVVVLYGHTHVPETHREGDIWVMNPGACGSTGGSVGLLEVEQGDVVSCRILTLEDLEDFK